MNQRTAHNGRAQTGTSRAAVAAAETRDRPVACGGRALGTSAGTFLLFYPHQPAPTTTTTTPPTLFLLPRAGAARGHLTTTRRSDARRLRARDRS